MVSEKGHIIRQCFPWKKKSKTTLYEVLSNRLANMAQTGFAIYPSFLF